VLVQIYHDGAATKPFQRGYFFMIRSEGCQAKAEECEQRARAATDPENKRQLEMLAYDWRQLAERVERILGARAATLHR
jgi:hypothetical protein